MLRPSFVCVHLGDTGGSAYYRVLTPVLLANNKGMIQIRIPDKMLFFPEEALATIKPDAMIFHRSHTESQKRYINNVAHNLDILKVYTIDDWVGKVPKESPHFKDIPANVDKDIKKVINQCDRLIVTNDLLAQVYGYKKDTYIIPNYLCQSIWDEIYKNPPTAVNNARPRIGWSGGMGHPGDLKLLKEVAQILGDRVQWVFLGDLPEGFDQGNSETHSPVPTQQYPISLYNLGLDLALAPLLDNEFNRAKSNLRILEYAACGYPVIASNVKPYKSAPVTLLDYNAKWWAEAISKKLDDLDALKAEGQALKQWVWETHKLEDHIVDYANILSPDGKAFIPQVPEVEDIVDVIVTTHNQKAVVERCIQSVIQSVPENKTQIELIVTDNASTEAGFADYLMSLENLDEVKTTIIRHKTDLGYIDNVNNAITLHPNRDIVTLNSDTVVSGNWLDKLKDGIYKNERIASMTPLSNNATILSYPKETGSELVPALVPFYNEVAAEAEYKYITIPTSVGFCTFYRRTTLADIGLFDSNAFGRGYGEENDWSMRALMRQWASAAALDTYVGHAGSATFKSEQDGLRKAANSTLQLRWQVYPQLLEQWLKAAPLKSTRQAMDLAVINKTNVTPRTLFISHGLGGGTDVYIRAAAGDTHHVMGKIDAPYPGFMQLSIMGEEYNNLPYLHLKSANVHTVGDLLHTMNVDKIYVQSTLSSDYNLPQWIMNVSKTSGIPYEVMLHDYWMICPRIRLYQNEYCGEPEVHECNKCMIDFGSIMGQVDVADWRLMYEKFLHGAHKVYAPSQDTRERYRKYYPMLAIECKPHEEEIESKLNFSAPYTEGEVIRVGVIGYTFNEKGSLVIQECAKYCEDNNVHLKFIVFGSLVDTTYNPPRKIEDNPYIFSTGPYQDSDLMTYLQLNKCHIAFFPALWPETYSYTLSHAMKAGLYPVSFDIGAIAERIKKSGFGEVLPLEFSKDPAKIINSLLAIVKNR